MNYFVSLERDYTFVTPGKLYPVTRGKITTDTHYDVSVILLSRISSDYLLVNISLTVASCQQ